MSSLYPEISPYKTHFLPVSDLHTIYVEESGNPEGVPVIFLHGALAEAVNQAIGSTSTQKSTESFYLINEGVGKVLPLQN